MILQQQLLVLEHGQGTAFSYCPMLSVVAFGVGDMSAGLDRHPRQVFLLLVVGLTPASSSH